MPSIHRRPGGNAGWPALPIDDRRPELFESAKSAPSLTILDAAAADPMLSYPHLDHLEADSLLLRAAHLAETVSCLLAAQTDLAPQTIDRIYEMKSEAVYAVQRAAMLLAIQSAQAKP